LISFLSYSPGFVDDNRDYLAEATTGFSTPDRPPGTLGLIVSGLETLPRALIGPAPDEIGPQPVWLWVVANTVYWLVLLAAVVVRFPGRADAPTNTGVGVALVLIAAVAIVGMAVTLTNYGIVVRMRGMPTFLLLPLVLAPLWSPRRDPLFRGRVLLS